MLLEPTHFLTGLWHLESLLLSDFFLFRFLFLFWAYRFVSLDNERCAYFDTNLHLPLHEKYKKRRPLPTSPYHTNRHLPALLGNDPSNIIVSRYLHAFIYVGYGVG